ncbi:C-type lectin domain family 4 member A-like [Patiria miniata]|uniref:C-type lectin domain-containing protein n=1 Tax=Patiria miniata TaxID=46514 RepID=A0A914ALT6_PATMI|nr:C-type lectin domain family 4 member A-like [Patiria miniata]
MELTLGAMFKLCILQWLPIWGFLAASISAANMMRCPGPGWQLWKGSCYVLTDKTSTWQEGKSACRSMGGRMAAPRSSEENDFFVSLAGPGGKVWIACKFNTAVAGGQLACEGVEAEFTKWHNGEPNNDSEECVLLKAISSGTWFDYSCQNPYPSVCKKRAAKPSRDLVCYEVGENGRLVGTA